MSSPGLESFCCVSQLNNSNAPLNTISRMAIYNTLSLVGAIMGFLGALTVLCSQIPGLHSTRFETIRSRLRSRLRVSDSFQHFASSRQFKTTQDAIAGQRSILRCLCISNLLACGGVILRSIAWLADLSAMIRIGDSEDVSFSHRLFCIMNTAWTLYFFTATYWWTFCYALDTLLILKGVRANIWLYHFLGWFVTLINVLSGLLPLYISTSGTRRCTHSRLNIIPHFCSIYIPLLIVMISYPLFFRFSIKNALERIVAETGRLSTKERTTVARFRRRFLLMMIIFFVCWTTNLINGIALPFIDEIHQPDIFMVLWFCMALINPLQGFFCAMVYFTFSSKKCNASKSSILNVQISDVQISSTSVTNSPSHIMDEERIPIFQSHIIH